MLADQPLCELCEAEGIVEAAVEVHHVQPIAQRPDLRLERGNLMCLCVPCHAEQDEQRRRAEQLDNHPGLRRNGRSREGKR